MWLNTSPSQVTEQVAFILKNVIICSNTWNFAKIISHLFPTGFTKNDPNLSLSPNQKSVTEAPSGACVGPLCIQCRIAHANGELTSKRESRIGLICCCGFELSNSFKCPFAEIETGKSFCQTTYWIYALRLNLVLFQSAIDCFICDGALWLLPQTCFLKQFF